MTPPSPPGAFPRGFDGHRRAQAGIGLAMTPAERLRWLEETMATMRRWVGRARGAPLASAGPGPSAAGVRPGPRREDPAPPPGTGVPAHRKPPR